MSLLVLMPHSQQTSGPVEDQHLTQTIHAKFDFASTASQTLYRCDLTARDIMIECDLIPYDP